MCHISVRNMEQYENIWNSSFYLRLTMYLALDFIPALLYFTMNFTFFANKIDGPFPGGVWWLQLAKFGSHPHIRLKWHMVCNPLDVAVKLCNIEFRASWQSCGGGGYGTGGGDGRRNSKGKMVQFYWSEISGLHGGDGWFTEMLRRAVS